MQSNPPSDIAARAYQLWEEEGRPHGRDLEHWQKAATELNPNGHGNGKTNGTAAAVAAKPMKSAPAKTLDADAPAKPKRKPGKSGK